MIERMLRIPAPAKLNLMLRIVGRRADGYHLLQTVFQFLDRSDWITLRMRRDGLISLSKPLPGVPAEEDLTVRAARALQQATGTGLGVEISVEKVLPMGGGLGGGSSDAASVLAGLNVLWNCGLGHDELSTLGLRLGADVPIFLFGRSAWAEGVGEHLTPLELEEPWYVVIVPPCHVSTAEIFNSPDLTRDNDPITIGGFVAGSRENHCLPVVVEHYPVVAQALEALSSVSEAPRLTGTGACVYADFAQEDEAQKALDRLAPEWDCFLAKGCNRSALYETLGSGPALDQISSFGA
jgi:4-diphosphocytidyl-2-C-methyl-D-erythritol kinase